MRKICLQIANFKPRKGLRAYPRTACPVARKQLAQLKGDATETLS